MLVELHILQNFAPANLNRDDTGSPKDCEFGGYRRARISSQCLKRAIRTCFRSEGLLPPDRLASRTKRLADQLTERLSTPDRDAGEARIVATTALKSIGLGLDDQDKTQYLLFVADTEIVKMVELCRQNWDTLLAVATSAQNIDESQSKGKSSAKDAKKQAKQAIPPELSKALAAMLAGGSAADLALFGRMLADLPAKNVDAACQVAHAISTKRVLENALPKSGEVGAS